LAGRLKFASKLKLLLRFFQYQFAGGTVLRDFPDQIVDVHAQHAAIWSARSTSAPDARFPQSIRHAQ
jgi:hypothetical protein